jgi:hypothetical protein
MIAGGFPLVFKREFDKQIRFDSFVQIIVGHFDVFGQNDPKIFSHYLDEEVGPLDAGNMFGGSLSSASHDGCVNGQYQRGCGEDESKQSKGIINRLAKEPRNATFIGIMTALLCGAIGIALNFNSRTRRARIFGNILTVLGVLAPLWLSVLAMVL